MRSPDKFQIVKKVALTERQNLLLEKYWSFTNHSAGYTFLHTLKELESEFSDLRTRGKRTLSQIIESLGELYTDQIRCDGCGQAISFKTRAEFLLTLQNNICSKCKKDKAEQGQLDLYYAADRLFEFIDSYRVQDLTVDLVALNFFQLLYLIVLIDKTSGLRQIKLSNVVINEEFDNEVFRSLFNLNLIYITDFDKSSTYKLLIEKIKECFKPTGTVVLDRYWTRWMGDLPSTGLFLNNANGLGYPDLRHSVCEILLAKSLNENERAKLKSALMQDLNNRITCILKLAFRTVELEQRTHQKLFKILPEAIWKLSLLEINDKIHSYTKDYAESPNRNEGRPDLERVFSNQICDQLIECISDPNRIIRTRDISAKIEFPMLLKSVYSSVLRNKFKEDSLSGADLFQFLK